MLTFRGVFKLEDARSNPYHFVAWQQNYSFFRSLLVADVADNAAVAIVEVDAVNCLPVFRVTRDRLYLSDTFPVVGQSGLVYVAITVRPEEPRLVPVRQVKVVQPAMAATDRG